MVDTCGGIFLVSDKNLTHREFSVYTEDMAYNLCCLQVQSKKVLVITGSSLNNCPMTDALENTPDLWCDTLPFPDRKSHKHSRGHTLVAGGPVAQTGAARLAAYAALRVGSGLVSIVSSPEALPVYAASCLAVMTKLVSSDADWDELLASSNFNSYLIGPGAGVTEQTKNRVLSLLTTGKPVVLDADALTVFKENPEELFSLLHENCVLTPHEGEFARLFSASDKDKVSRAAQAAQRYGAVMVLKGADTVIAMPDGHAHINNNAPPWLATAGSGDVLSGIIAGLMAQGMPGFFAASAAVWMHGQAATYAGVGMIAEDLLNHLPNVLKFLYDKKRD